MSIAQVQKLSGQSTANTSSAAFTTADLGALLTAGNLGIAVIANGRQFGGTPTTPTCSGLGQTWAPIKTQTFFSSDAVDDYKLSAFYAPNIASPSGGGVTFDFAGVAQETAGWGVFEYSGADPTTPILQTNNGAEGGPGTSVAGLALAAFADAVNNMAFAVFGVDSNVAMTPKAGWTEQIDVQVPGNFFFSPLGIEVQQKTGQDLAPSASWTGSLYWGGIAFEIKASGVTAPGILAPAGQALYGQLIPRFGEQTWRM